MTKMPDVLRDGRVQIHYDRDRDEVRITYRIGHADYLRQGADESFEDFVVRVTQFVYRIDLPPAGMPIISEPFVYKP